MNVAPGGKAGGWLRSSTALPAAGSPAPVTTLSVNGVGSQAGKSKASESLINTSDRFIFMSS